eukprot:gene13351-15378_t
MEFAPLVPLLEDKTYLAAKSREEEFVYVLERTGTNAKYKCRNCMHTFSGGNQKIRVHITGVKEGGSSVKACSNPDPEAVAHCSAPRLTHKRKVGSDERAQAKKLAKLAEAEKQTLVYKEAWELLHTPGKLRSQESTTDTANVNMLHSSLPVVTNQPVFIKESSSGPGDVLAFLSELGMEKAEDFAHLEQEHLLKLSEFLKVVPRKQFLELLRVYSPPLLNTMSDQVHL